MRFTTLLLCSQSNFISLFMSSFMGLISNLPLKLFRAKFLFIKFFWLFNLVFQFKIFYFISSSPSWVSCFVHWFHFSIYSDLISTSCNLFYKPNNLLYIYFWTLSSKDANLLSSISSIFFRILVSLSFLHFSNDSICSQRLSKVTLLCSPLESSVNVVNCSH